MKTLNFSCGSDIRQDCDNCDIQKQNSIIYCDADKFPFPFKDNTYDKIICKQAFSYYLYPRRVLDEFWRICKPNAIIEIDVPYYNNKGAYTDLDSLHYFNEQGFEMLCKAQCRKDKKEKFELLEVYIRPTWLFRYAPNWIRKRLNSLISGVYDIMFIKLRIIK